MRYGPHADRTQRNSRHARALSGSPPTPTEPNETGRGARFRHARSRARDEPNETRLTAEFRQSRSTVIARSWVPRRSGLGGRGLLGVLPRRVELAAGRRDRIEQSAMAGEGRQVAARAQLRFKDAVDDRQRAAE